MSEMFLNGLTLREIGKKLDFSHERVRQIIQGGESYIKFRKDYCERCGLAKRAQAHHIDHDRKNNKEENITTLCYKCHTIEHRDRGEPNHVPFETKLRRTRKNTWEAKYKGAYPY